MALRKCPVESCDYHSAKGFYLIPEHPVRRQAWIDACKLPPTFNKKICFQHFKVSDFINEITEEDIAQARFGKLKKNVVPSVHLPGDPGTNVEGDTFEHVVIEDAPVPNVVKIVIKTRENITEISKKEKENVSRHKNMLEMSSALATK